MTAVKKKLDVRALVMGGIFTALIAIGAFIRIPVPVVPFTLQLFFVTMAGFLLGPRGGAVSAGLYMALGLIGLPIFTEGGGPMYVLKPTFGYIIGFVVTAYLVGKIAYGAKNPSYKRLLFAAMAGLVVCYTFGVLYCYGITNWVLGIKNGFWHVFWVGAVMVAPGDIALGFLAAMIAKRVLPHLQYLYR